MGTVTRLFDGLANVLTGRGTTVDRSVHNVWMRRFQDPSQIEAAYLGSWLHRKIVDIPAQDMTRAGRDWDAEDDQIAAIEKEERRLGYWPKLYEALTLGRLGGGAIVIGFGDSDPSQPAPTNIRPQQIRYLTVLSRYELTLGEIEQDPQSENFRQPKTFGLSGTLRQIQIHPSRVVCFKGLPIPAIRTATWEDRFWGMSIVEAVDEPVQQATAACAGFASLIEEAKVDVYRFKGLAETLLQPGGDEKVMKRIEVTQQGKSAHRAAVMDAEDEWEQRQLSLAGVRDVIITFDGRLAGAAEMPATKLFGKSPDGMNSTGEGDDKGYRDTIAAKQDMQLRPNIERIDAYVLPSAGVPADLSWKFSGLASLSEKDEADIELKEAQALEKLVSLAMVPESAMAKTIQNRLIESGRFPGLKKLIEEAEKKGEELPDKVDESELGIVPLGYESSGKEGDLASAGSGGAARPARRAMAANDAWMLEDWAAKPLYVRRDVINRADIVKWAESQGFTDIAPDLHVTITYSRTPVDWMAMGESWRGKLEIEAGGPRLVEALGPDGKYKALLFTAYELISRNQDMRDKGASFDWPEYQPHISIQVGGDIDLAMVKPYTGKIVLGPEIFEEIRP
jgi:phage-related protein (TIGR01555 family)